MPDVYGAYKPLRNYLRTVDLINALGACRWHINYFQLSDPPPPPRDLQVDPILYKKGMSIYMPWQLAVLAREVIIESRISGYTRDFRNARDFGNAFNKLKAIDSYIGASYINQENVYHFVTKAIPHQQFMWQENKPNYQTLTRYYTIYRHPQLKPIFEQFFGVSVDKYFALSMLTWSRYFDFLGSIYPPPESYLKELGITQAEYMRFLGHYALPLDELRQRLTDPSERHFDHDFLYYFDSLKRFPVLLIEDQGQQVQVCPVPTYLFWRTTDGIYYELANEEGFSQALGEGFKSYVGDVLNNQPYPRAVTVLDADTYVDARRPKADWMFIEAEHALFIECKAKRMTIGAKYELDFSPVTGEQLQKLADSIVQCYKATLDAAKRGYTELSGVKYYHPVIVTLESWYVVGDIAQRLEALVQQTAVAKGIDASIAKRYPYLVLSTYELEALVAVLRKKSAVEVISPFFTDPQYKYWQFESYMGQAFRNEQVDAILTPNPLDGAFERLSGGRLRLGEEGKWSVGEKRVNAPSPQ